MDHGNPGAQRVKIPGPFQLDWGGHLSELEIEFETWGQLSPEGDNAILICPAFSAHSHARSHPRDPSRGWWEEMIGPGLALDPERFFILCPSLLGGSHGTTGPRSLNPETGRPFGGTFPVISIRDMAAVHRKLLDSLGLNRVHALVGGSMGAMEAMEISMQDPGRAARVIAFSGTARTMPFTAAIRYVGRLAILSDPAFDPTDEIPDLPERGLTLARQIGSIFYRSRQDFNTRFSCQPIADPAIDALFFDFHNYLDHQGRKIVGHFDPNAYLRLSLSMDLHDLGRGHSSMDAALQSIESEYLVIGVPQDPLIPIDEQLSFHRDLVRLGKKSTWVEFSSPFGHDAFLKEFEWQRRQFRAFLD